MFFHLFDGYIESESRLASLVSEHLSEYEFAVDVVARVNLALAHFAASSPDLVVFDLTLRGPEIKAR
jgi:two-component system OmpR family response regulator